MICKTFMRKLALFIFLLHVSLYPSISDSLRKFLKMSSSAKEQIQSQVIENQVLQPRIVTLYLLQDVNFKELMWNLYTAGKDPNIHGIILIIDNYGGVASIFSALHDLVRRIKIEKPIVSLVVGYAFSGAYLVASSTHYIIAATISEVGSIGVIQEVHTYQNAQYKDKIVADLNVELFRAGTYKSLTNPFHNLNDQEKGYLKEELQKAYDIFVATVAYNRNLDSAQHSSWADGKIFLAPEALALNLIDKIGTIYDAEEKMIQLVQERYPEKNIIFPMIPITYDAPNK